MQNGVHCYESSETLVWGPEAGCARAGADVRIDYFRLLVELYNINVYYNINVTTISH